MFIDVLQVYDAVAWWKDPTETRVGCLSGPGRLQPAVRTGPAPGTQGRTSSTHCIPILRYGYPSSSWWALKVQSVNLSRTAPNLHKLVMRISCNFRQRIFLVLIPGSVLKSKVAILLPSPQRLYFKKSTPWRIV